MSASSNDDQQQQYRLTMQFGEKVRAQFQKCKKLAGLEDHSFPSEGAADIEVIRRALTLYEALLVEHGNNRAVVVLDVTGQILAQVEVVP
mgnify:CR=1 FL=1